MKPVKPRRIAPDLEKMLRAIRVQPAAKPGRSLTERLAQCVVEYAARSLSRDLPEIDRRVLRPCEADLRQRLCEIMAQCMQVRFEAFCNASLALERRATPASIRRSFLSADAASTLSELFLQYPELGGLITGCISNWRRHLWEIVRRFADDGAKLTPCLIIARRLGQLREIRIGLSDPHAAGRTVALLRCEYGCVIYKPRSGRWEDEWMALLAWMNSEGFPLRFKTARVLRRRNYCWMEYVRPMSSRTAERGRDYLRRCGALLCLAQLSRVIDCHKENVISAGEHPVLVDAEVRSLRHAQAETTMRERRLEFLRTGWLPQGQRTSPLEGGLTSLEQRCVRDGYAMAWNFLLAHPGRRASFRARMKRWSKFPWRILFRSTSEYAALSRASLHPAYLRSRERRRSALQEWCERPEEIRALLRLDIPRLTRRPPSAEISVPNGDSLGHYLLELQKIFDSA